VVLMAKYNNILEIDNQNPQIQELKAVIKDNRDKSMHVKYMVNYHHLKGAANVDIARMFDLCAHTVGTYINKYKAIGLSSLLPAPKSGRLSFSQKSKKPNLRMLLHIIHLIT
jgi:transposase